MKLLILILAMPLFADDPVLKSGGVSPVVQITAEEKLEYRRLQVNLFTVKEQNVAREAAAQKLVNEKIDALTRKCGDLPLIGDEKGDPICGAPKPEPKK